MRGCVAVAVAVAVREALPGVSDHTAVSSEGVTLGPVLLGSTLWGLLAFVWPSPMWDPCPWRVDV